MTLAKLLEALRKNGISAAFVEFEKPTKPPYATGLIEGDATLYCNGKIVYSLCDTRLELYTEKRDCTSEKKVKDLFDQMEIAYKTDKTWITEDKLYEIIFYFQTETEELN